MAEYDYALCLFCLSGKENEVVDSIRKKGYGHALFPRKIKHYRNGEEWKPQVVPLVPGYVFVYLTEEEKDCRYKLSDTQDVIRVLGYGDEAASWLRGADLEFAELIWKKNGTIGDVRVAKFGDRVEIVDEDFMHLRDRVVRIDKRKKMILIQADGAGIVNNVWLPYSMVEGCEERATVVPQEAPYSV